MFKRRNKQPGEIVKILPDGFAVRFRNRIQRICWRDIREIIFQEFEFEADKGLRMALYYSNNGIIFIREGSRRWQEFFAKARGRLKEIAETFQVPVKYMRVGSRGTCIIEHQL